MGVRVSRVELPCFRVQKPLNTASVNHSSSVNPFGFLQLLVRVAARAPLLHDAQLFRLLVHEGFDAGDDVRMLKVC